jgi:hypothetical protein
MQSWQTRVLILVTIAGQALSAIWGGQPVFFAHCHEHHEDCGSGEGEPGCDPSSCLALITHEHAHDEHLAEPAGNHRCHCRHFHVRGDAQRFERGRAGETVRKQSSQPAALPGVPPRDLLPRSSALAAPPDLTAASPPHQRLLAIESVRLLV